MRVHFIAIGGSVMHNLAISLASSGYIVTGSDDEIHDPSGERLKSAGLLPETNGWFPDKITTDLDAIIVGMHAKIDNPELLKAKELNLKIYSFPEFVYANSVNKQRIVISGSHGKTTITSMIMHALKSAGYEFDYLVGARVNGFERNVHLTKDNPFIIIEGDEYFASPLDPRPKFLIYDPHILVVSGVSWDHINVFPTEEDYVEPFVKLIGSLSKAAACIYNKEDKTVRDLVNKLTDKELHSVYPYYTPSYKVNKSGISEIKLENRKFPIKLIGRHNASNIAAAWEVCKLLALSFEEFIAAISVYEGAAMRLQKIYEDDHTVVIRDFAHAPSKVIASVEAVAEHYKDHNVIACLELHTYSSLNKAYLSRYSNSLKKIKNKLVLVSNKTLQLKKLPNISALDIRKAFQDNGIRFVQNKIEMLTSLKSMLKKRDVILLMSSGNFEGLDVKELL